jgi:hypothetical protein
MTKLFKTRQFAHWMTKTELTDVLLLTAVCEMEQGLIDAELGGGIVKKRIALKGKGKRGSTRTLIATNKHNRWFFIFGFEKNERANISDKELKYLKQLANSLLKNSDSDLLIALENKTLLEISHEKN